MSFLKNNFTRNVAIFFFGVAIVFSLLMIWDFFSGNYKKTSQGKGTFISSATTPKTLKLSLEKLAPLDRGHFEGWILVDGKEVSFGKFQVDSKGKIRDLGGEEILDGKFQVSQDLSKASKIRITIEPDGDSNDIPTQSVILEGEFSDGQSQISFFAVDLASSSGKYILETPTDTKKDGTAGVWFTNLDASAASLNLPKAPTGFKYEAWVSHQGIALSCGRFSDSARPDESAKFSGKIAGPPYPGEDFLVNAPKNLPFKFPPDLVDGASKVIVSLEPDFLDQDQTGDKPFQLQFLTGMIPENAKTQTLYDLILDSTTIIPGGIAKIEN
jgi:hypothetical protein